MLKYGRMGEYKGQTYFFTHINNITGMVYSPDIKSFVDNMFGMWVDKREVKWKDE